MTNKKPAEAIAPELNEGVGKVTVLEALQEHQSALKRFISRFVLRSNDIDDVVQETFLRAFNAEKGRVITHPKSFLFKIARNIAITELTRKSTRMMDFLEEIDESDSEWGYVSAEDEVSAQEVIGVHCEAVAQLPPQCRRIYLMRKVHGLSYREIAQRCSITISTVEQHLAKGTRSCRLYVESRQA
ncbi:MAG: RNA polymerase sigma factor, partial [Porticoccaceae bacterium]|nr:RNA polymerase sigma factor [Porticoccaceae bacterium]